MEYYYCPSLLKFLRYLWVSAGRCLSGRCLSVSVSSSFPPPPPAKFAFWLCLSAVSVFFHKWRSGAGGRDGGLRTRRSPDCPGVSGHEWPWEEKRNREIKDSVRELSGQRHFFDFMGHS